MAHSLNVSEQLQGKTILLYGGTGFLGKVWMSLVLAHFPNIEHLYMVVRSRKRSDGSIRQSSQLRFLTEIATSAAFDPIREQYPKDAYMAFMNEKVTAIDGDVTNPFGGISDELRDQIRGKVDILVNSSGVVDFNPPLDKSLDVNAFGMQNLVALAKDLGNIKFLHTSTCYVAGDRTGQVNEIDPLTFPFPKADSLDVKHWDPDQEIKECMDMVTHAKRRAKDAFRQSDFLDLAKNNLIKKGEPTRGKALVGELKRVERKFIEDQLVVEGTERAQFWGWHNIYTYTKTTNRISLSNYSYFECFELQLQLNNFLEYILDLPHSSRRAFGLDLLFQSLGAYDSLVAIGMVLSCAELLEDTHKIVYQYGTSASNPLAMYRLVELVSLHKRRRLREKGKNPFLSAISQRIEATPVSVNTYWSRGPQIQAKQIKRLGDWLKPLEKGVLSSLAKPARKSISGLVKNLDITGKITDQFVPFTATHNYRFSTLHTDVAYERLSDAEKELLPWLPLDIDWREYILDIHCPGLVENVFPLVEEKKNKKSKPLRSYDHLVDMLDEIAERYEHLPALMRTHEDGFTRVSYKELRSRAHAVALKLQQAGVQVGDRVYLSGANHPDWSICYFGILVAGAVAVPLDVALTPVQAITIDTSAQATVGIFDSVAMDAFGRELSVEPLDLHFMAEETPGAEQKTTRIEIDESTLASVLYTSGTTGVPKGVMLSHGNFTSMLASLGKLFSVSSEDRLLSVLPLHHTFEFSCGLLMPLSLGASIIYLDEVTGEQLSHGLQAGQVTAMVGVPALWQLLERRIKGQIQDQGTLFEALIDAMLELNRRLGRTAKLDLGRLLFAPIHGRLGGNIKFLISGGAALPPDTQKFFSGLGLHLTEGYGLTEAAPVLTVSTGGPGVKAGTVGNTVPGVEIKVINKDDNGVGEVLARGENVMQGYFNNSNATESALDNDGWLHTGDMGRLDHKKRLFLVGRAKEVVVTSSGENIYLDDAEHTLGTIRLIKEFTLVGIANPRGGERLGLLAVVDSECDEAKKLNRDDLMGEALDAIKKKVGKLVAFQRPAVIHIVAADLPRTRTRKVQRKSSAEILQKIIDATPTRAEAKKGTSGAINKAISIVAGVSIDKVSLDTNLQGDLGFDSLMAVELAAALSNLPKIGSPDPDDVAKCETVADIVKLVGQPETEKENNTQEKKKIPEPFAVPMKQALGWAQRTLYGTGLHTEVIGRDNIPQNRQLIVVSNHCSHLDMGLVKYALGPYGHKLVALAAKDYFFEGNPWAVAYFEQLTNLKPIDRRRGYSASLQQAKDIVDKGHIVLLFPEGTRRQDGILTDFKPLMGQLSLETMVDVLPMHLGGTFEAMPKGAVVPQKRDLKVRIGAPIEIRRIQPWLEGLNVPQQSRVITRLAQECVAALQQDHVLHIDKRFVDKVRLELFPPVDQEVIVKKTVTEDILDELQRRYNPERVQKPSKWALVLNGKGGPRYTLDVNAQKFVVRKGKHDADIAIITTDSFLRKIVFEGFTPGIPEFMSGTIKSNNPMGLPEFQKLFNLKEPTQ